MCACLGCGHYESNSPAFKRNPELFTDSIRNNPTKFLQKYVINSRKVTDHCWKKETDEDETAPENMYKLNTQKRLSLDRKDSWKENGEKKLYQSTKGKVD